MHFDADLHEICNTKYIYKYIYIYIYIDISSKLIILSQRWPLFDTS